MTPLKAAATLAEMYDLALRYARDKRVPPDVARPCPTRDWLPENLDTLRRYVDWLEGGGTSAMVIRTYHIPMAGHVLALIHKPSVALDLERDLDSALAYIRAKQLGHSWTRICRLTLLKFRRFLLHERGLVESRITPYDPAPNTKGLPAWLVEQLTRYQHVKQRNWREARIEEGIRRFWLGHLRVWRFLVERHAVQELGDIRRVYFTEYVDERLQAGAAVKTVNGDLRTFHGFMEFLQDQGLGVPRALLRLRCLKEPDPLPRFLTDAHVRALRDDLEEQVRAARKAAHRRNAVLDRACFYLLWQAGLRKGEVEDLRLEDLDLGGRRLTVRRGKGQVDRTVFLTDTTVAVLRDYLAMRGPGPTDHVFLYRNQALSKDLIHGRLKMCGARTGVAVHAHRLRHTCATQLLNAGCRITSIQKVLGHRRLDTTLTYARAHDQTVEQDYFRAMASVEQRLDLAGQPDEQSGDPVAEDERSQLLALAAKLSEPEISVDARLVIAERIRLVLAREQVLVYREHPPPVNSSMVFKFLNEPVLCEEVMIYLVWGTGLALGRLEWLNLAINAINEVASREQFIHSLLVNCQRYLTKTSSW